MKNLIILNDAPYGNERSYNGLRLAGTLSKQQGEDVKIFLIGDAAACSKRGQKVPQGYYNIEVMLKNVVNHGAQVGVCGTCLDARGFTETDIIEGSHRSTMTELTEWTVWADKVMVF